MPNIARVFKDEIARISRHEAKQAVAPFRKPTSTARRTFADLKRRLAALEKSDKQLRAALAKITAAVPQPAPAAAEKARITGKGMRSLQKRLRLSGSEFAKLLGVTGQVVYKWGKTNGALRVRDATKAAILAIRDLTATEAKVRLAQMPAKKAKPAVKRGRRKGRK